MPAARARIRCSDTFEYTRSRMSFQPRGGISEGVVASRPRPSSSAAARGPADEDTLDRSPPRGGGIQSRPPQPAGQRLEGGSHRRTGRHPSLLVCFATSTAPITGSVQVKRERAGAQERSCCPAKYFARLQGAPRDGYGMIDERTRVTDDVRRQAETEMSCGRLEAKSVFLPGLLLRLLVQLDVGSIASLGIPADALPPILSDRGEDRIRPDEGHEFAPPPSCTPSLETKVTGGRLAAVRVGRCFRRPRESQVNSHRERGIRGWSAAVQPQSAPDAIAPPPVRQQLKPTSD